MASRFKACAVESCNDNAHHDGGGRRGWCNAHYLRWRRHGDTSVVLSHSPALDWLRAHVNYTGDECLRWPFSIGKDGYARVHRPEDGRLTTGSNLMCQFAHGPQPTPKHEAAHSCGKGHEACVSPRHVYWATPTENHADKVTHGTTNRGERQGRSRLTETDVISIRALYGTMSNVAIAELYGVDRSHVSKIAGRHSWAWLP